LRRVGFFALCPSAAESRICYSDYRLFCNVPCHNHKISIPLGVLEQGVLLSPVCIRVIRGNFFSINEQIGYEFSAELRYYAIAAHFAAEALPR
jgi:hypothetical protein